MSPWALATNALEYTKKLASALGCPNESHRSSLMLYCLRQKTASEILDVDLDIPSHLVAFGPTVDGMVIPNEPLLLMGDLPSHFGNYDLMFGVTAAEGYNGVSHLEKHGIDTARRDRILRTLVRNLFTYHLQVSTSLSLYSPSFVDSRLWLVFLALFQLRPCLYILYNSTVLLPTLPLETSSCTCVSAAFAVFTLHICVRVLVCKRLCVRLCVHCLLVSCCYKLGPEKNRT